MKKQIAFLMLITSLFVVGCSEKAPEKVVLSPDELAASVDDWTLSKKLLEKTIADMPEQQQRKWDNPQGRAEITRRYIEEELYYREAEAAGLEETERVRVQIETARRQILISEYQKQFVEAQAAPADEAIHDFYEANLDQYMTLEVVRASQIFMKDREALEAIKERIVEGGESFATLAQRHSEDKESAVEGGDLGFFNPGGYIRGIGFSEPIHDAIAQAQVDEVIGPIKWRKGWSIIRVTERRPAELRPYQDVKDEITRVLIKDRIESTKHDIYKQLATKYEPRNYMEELYESVQRSPEELWNFAQSSDNPQTRLDTFQEIIDRFPNDDYAPQAMFMLGFVYAEELSDVVMADKTWNRLLNTYPDNEIAETARWMIENLGKPLPKFDSLEDLNEQRPSD